METLASRRRKICHSLQLVLVLLTFCLDFGHGIVLGEYNIAFEPVYRLRDSMAIAISRMHKPPARGYLAYRSVVNALDQDGFAIFPSDQGMHLNPNGWKALLKDPARLDKALQDAKNVNVDPSLPPEIIRGNELGYADYIYVAFLLFGSHFTSFYFFYFVLLAASVALFLFQYSRSPFLMFLLTSYLAALFFLQNYALVWEDQMESIANGRLFDALSLLPAMHLYVAVWRKLPPKPLTLAMAFAQATILIFLFGTRTAVLWQVVMIVAAGMGAALFGALMNRHTLMRRDRRFLPGIWPAAVTVILLATQFVLLKVDRDPRYAQETGYHLIWHSVLVALLEASPRLRSIYVGNNTAAGDQIAYDAVMKDLTERHDARSPIAYIQHNGNTIQIAIDLERSNAAYDALARSLALRMIAAHPLAVINTIPRIASVQIDRFGLPSILAWPNTFGAVSLTVLAGLLWMGSERGRISMSDATIGAAAAFILLACSLIPVPIASSSFSVGTLISFLIAIPVGLFVFAFSTVTSYATLVVNLRRPKLPTDVSHSA